MRISTDRKSEQAGYLGSSDTLKNIHGENFLSTKTNDPFLKNIIIGDEKWVFYKNVQCKRIDKDEFSQSISKVEL